MRIFILKNSNLNDLITDLKALLMRYCTYHWMYNAFNFKDIEKTQKDENNLFNAKLKIDGELIELKTNTYKFDNRIEVIYMGENGTYYDRKSNYDKKSKMKND